MIHQGTKSRITTFHGQTDIDDILTVYHAAIKDPLILGGLTEEFVIIFAIYNNLLLFLNLLF